VKVLRLNIEDQLHKVSSPVGGHALQAGGGGGAEVSPRPPLVDLEFRVGGAVTRTAQCRWCDVGLPSGPGGDLGLDLADRASAVQAADLARDLHLFFSSTREEAALAAEQMDADGHQLALSVDLKSYQRIGQFPMPDEYPEVVVDFVRRGGGAAGGRNGQMAVPPGELNVCSTPPKQAVHTVL
jgi:hypothetical protein